MDPQGSSRHTKEDKFYIDQVVSGDSSAFAVLVDRYKNFVYQIVVKILTNNELAEEVAQDTFVKVFQKLSSFEEKANFSTWVYRIAYNTAISMLRKQKKELLFLSQEDQINYLSDQSLEDDNENESLVDKQRLQEALSKLSSSQQLLVDLYYTKELSIEEISRMVGLSRSNVKVKLFRARKKLLNYMQKNTTANKTI